MDIAHARLVNQHLVTPLATPREVVRWFGAVQAQEYLQSLWAIGVRLPVDATESTIKHAVASREILRTWSMRGTIHYVLAEDARWMTELLAQRVNQRFRTILQKVEITDAILAISRDVFTKVLQGNKQLTRKELYAHLEQAGIVGATTRGMYLLTYWAQAGLLCFGPHQEKQPTFVLLDEWVPQARRLNGETALATLAQRYFTSHGPATVQDFAWWSGLTMLEAKQAIELIRSDFVSEVYQGKQYWLSRSTQSGILQKSVLLLPCFDEYTVAYKDRTAAIDAALLKDAGYAVNNNNIVVNGRIIGAWKRNITKNTVQLQLHLSRELLPSERVATRLAAARYGRFLDLEAIIDVEIA